MRHAVVLGLALVLTSIALAPSAAAAVPNGCTFQFPLFFCFQEESTGQDCGSEGASGSQFTAVGAGVIATVGASAAGFASCGPGGDQDTLVAGASVGTVFVNAVWVGRGEPGAACFVILSAPGVPAAEAPCPAGMGPPNAGWGHVAG
jgi:hypothetical protein